MQKSRTKKRMKDGNEHSGSCLCGAVRMSIRTADDHFGACHCRMCRKWAGGPLFAVECGDGVRIEGENSVTVYQSSEWAERGFCSRCGTHLFYRLKGGGTYGVPLGLLDTDAPWSFQHQIYIDNKPPYYAFANETQTLTEAEVMAMFSQGAD